MKNRAAVSLGRRGGRVKSEKKTLAARENGKKGGRPRFYPQDARARWDDTTDYQNPGWVVDFTDEDGILMTIAPAPEDYLAPRSRSTGGLVKRALRWHFGPA